jgi:hypothetical protein
MTLRPLTSSKTPDALLPAPAAEDDRSRGTESDCQGDDQEQRTQDEKAECGEDEVEGPLGHTLPPVLPCNLCDCVYHVLDIDISHLRVDRK